MPRPPSRQLRNSSRRVSKEAIDELVGFEPPHPRVKEALGACAKRLRGSRKPGVRKKSAYGSKPSASRLSRMPPKMRTAATMRPRSIHWRLPSV